MFNRFNVLKDGYCFALLSDGGDLQPEGTGLFFHDTRYLDTLQVLVDGRPLAAARAAPAEPWRAAWKLPDGERSAVVADGCLYQRIRLAAPARVSIYAGSSFHDVFELRGTVRARRGDVLPPQLLPDGAVLSYRGLDGVLYETRLQFRPPPHAMAVEGGLAVAHFEAAAVEVAAAVAGAPVLEFDRATRALAAAHARWRAACTAIEVGDERLQAVIERSIDDLHLLTIDNGQGSLFAAGLPWYAVPFGRDAAISSLQTLLLCPETARASLCTLAALQGRESNPERQEEPGKIHHEFRQGEMTRLGEVPYGRYYGSVDATPLFLITLAAYVRWTGDRALLEELRPAALAALRWIDRHGDLDGDGFIEFMASGRGLTVQSWKDSASAMPHRDGSPAPVPLAVSEVQGYVYQAWAAIAGLLGLPTLRLRAAALRRSFNQRFWLAEHDFFALALDRDKRPLEVLASDAGHCLWSGIVDRSKAAVLVRRLLQDDLFSPWGLRTLAAGQAAYDPLSYHNGSVWPHDNSIVAAGLKRYGFDREAALLADAVLRAGALQGGGRLPEVLSGAAPEPLPIACTPQAWAAAAPIFLLQCVLGLAADGAARRITLRPHLPDGMGGVRLRRLRVGAGSADIEVSQGGRVRVLRNEGVEVRT